MLMPVTQQEPPVEERIAKLETHVEHIQADVTEIKSQLHRLEQRVDKRFDSGEAKNDERFNRVDQRLEALQQSQFDLRLAMEKGFSRLTLWGLTLYVTLAGTMLAVMAKGFGWIGGP